MRKILKKLLFTLVLLLILFISGFFFIVFTTPGLSTLVAIATIYLPGTIKIQGLQGRLSNQFSINELDYERNQIHIKVRNLVVNWHLKSLTHYQLPISNLSADRVELIHNKSLFVLHNIHFSGLVDKQHIAMDSLTFNYLDQSILTQMQLNINTPYNVNGTIKLNPVTKNKQQLVGGLSINGDINLLNWAGDFHGPLASLELNGSLNHLEQFDQIIKWHHLQWPISAIETVTSQEGSIKVWGALPHINLQFTSKVNRTPQEQWQITADINGSMPWLWNFDINLTQPYNASAKQESLYTTLSAIGTLKDKNHGQVTLSIKPGHYRVAQDKLINSLDFQGGVIKASLSPQKFAGNGVLSIDEHKKLNIAFNLPHFDLSKGLPKTQPIAIDLSLLFDSFEFLNTMTPTIKNPKGSLIASLKTTGTVGKPKFESNIVLSKASVELPVLGLNLNALDFNIVGKEKHWEGTGSISSGDKKLVLQGKGLLNPEFKGEFSLQGADFPLMNTHEYQIKISPQLKARYAQNLLDVSGTVLVPYAQIKPQSFSNSLDLSEDVVFKTTEKELPTTPLTTKIDIKVAAGEEVELTTKGLHATLTGIVNLTQQPNAPMSATGELNVVEGEYKAYGQNLAIEHGELFFTGGRVDNPGINLRAAKKIDTSSTSSSATNQLLDFNNNNLQDANVRGNLSVGVEVTGRLTEPKIQLFSNPSILSQADILSMLVLGRPANQANKAGGQLLLAAISSMNLSGGTKGTQLLEQLKQNLGVDFNIQNNSNYNLVTNTVSDGTAFVVSKSISKRISLSYNVGLSQSDPNVLTLKYLLNKFFSIQVSSSNTSNGIDVLYTSSKK
jgi:translocation and assembly module TamB